MDTCQLFADDWDMPARSDAICGCRIPARQHPRRPVAFQPGY